MADVRLIKHKAVPKCGSFEVPFANGAPSRFIYWDDVPGRRLRSAQIGSEEALEQARAFARAERDRLASSKCDVDVPPFERIQGRTRALKNVPNNAVSDHDKKNGHNCRA
jgi:hypothetical protein